MLTDASATREDGLLTLRLYGRSPEPNVEATIVGYYPGTIMHSTDPRSAQIFISEGRRPERKNKFCTSTSISGSVWIINHIMHDNYHKTVEIYINGCLVRKIRIIENTSSGIYKVLDF